MGWERDQIREGVGNRNGGPEPASVSFLFFFLAKKRKGREGRRRGVGEGFL